MLPLRGESGPQSNGNEGALRIPQSSSITGTSGSDRLVSYIFKTFVGRVLPLTKEAVDVFYSPHFFKRREKDFHNILTGRRLVQSESFIVLGETIALHIVKIFRLFYFLLM